MKIEIHTIGTTQVAEITSDQLVINQIEDGLDLIGNTRYQGAHAVILHEQNINPEFFDLSTGMAGEILQKFSTYQLRLFIVGHFEKYPGKSLRDFIRESNKGRQVNFLNSAEEALKSIS